MKFNKKILTLVLPLVLAVALVTGALLTYYGVINLTVNVEQAVTLDGDGCGDNVCLDDVGQVYSPDTRISGLYTLTNNDPENSRNIELMRTSCTPDCVGITTSYTTTITEVSGGDAYYDDARIMVSKKVGDMIVSQFLAEPFEYTVNVISNPLYAPNLIFWITDGTDTYVVETWGKGPEIPWTAGLQTVTIQDFFSGAMGYEVTVDTNYGQVNRIDSERPGTYTQWKGTGITEFIDDYGTWTVLSAQIRAQAGAAGGQVIRPVQFKAGGTTMNMPDSDTFTSLTLQSGEILNFYVINDFMTSGTQAYTIITGIKPTA